MPHNTRLFSPIIFMIAYVAIAHFFIPNYNEGEDFLFFSDWPLFSHGPNKISYDLTWDEGETFLFRDHHQKMLQNNIDAVVLFYLINQYGSSFITTPYKNQLSALAPLCSFRLYTFRAPYYRHILEKEPLSPIKEELFCEN